MFFCAAVIQAVNLHQGLLRASVASIGQDHRLGANEAPPAIISIFLGAELEKAFEAIASGEGDGKTPAADDGAGRQRAAAAAACTAATATGPRRSPSPATSSSSARSGSSKSLAFPNTVLNTIVAESIDDLADGLEQKLEAGVDLAKAVDEVVGATYSANKQVCFDGDNYDRGVARGGREARAEEPEDHARRAARGARRADRGSRSRSTTCSPKRELESRFEVWLEQYTIRANIEAETADSIARTMILPAAMRYLELIDESGDRDGREGGPRR